MHTSLKIIKKYSWQLVVAIFFYAIAIIAYQYNLSKSSFKNVVNAIEINHNTQQQIGNNIFKQIDKKKFEQLSNIGVLIYSPSANKEEKYYYNNNNYNFNIKLVKNALDTSYLNVHNNEIDFIQQKFISNKHTIVQVVIPLQKLNSGTSIVNFEYLNKQFYLDTTASKISLKLKSFPTLYLNRNTSITNTNYGVLSNIPICIAFIFLFLFLNVITKKISKEISFNIGFVILIATLVLLRISLFYFPFPIDTTKLSLFDPTIYASNKINRSLGDLLINVFFIGWIVGFLRYHNFKFFRKIQANFPQSIAALNILLLFSVTILCIRIIQSLVLDSKIPLNALDFFSLDRFTIIAFCVLSGLVLFFLKSLNLLLLHVQRKQTKPWYQYVCLASSAIIFIISYKSHFQLYTWVFVWLFLLLIILNTKWFKQSILNKTFSLLIASVIFFSISISIILHNQIITLNKLEQNKISERLHTLLELDKEFIEQAKSYETEYKIAIYKNDTLAFNFGEFPFSSVYKNANSINGGNRNFNLNNAFYSDSGIRVILAKEKTSTLLLITFFNYFVCCFFAMAFFVITLPKVFSFSQVKYQELFLTTISSKILAIVLIAAISIYVVLAIFTIDYFIKNFKKGIDDGLIKSSTLLINSVKTKIDTSKNAQLDNFNFFTANNNLNSYLVYDKNGIIVKNDTNIINNNQSLMNSDVLKEFRNNKPLYILTNETINSNSFKVIYHAIFAKNNTLGYVKIPLEKVEVLLKQETNGLIATLVNLSALFFILIFIAVYFFASQITKSLKMIGTKMNRINLEQYNETIDWQRNDEIGLLVKQYNKMVLKLADSAKDLALNEREGAWKEMAKQVAHEIKNPLTPMKLSVQHLQNQIKNNPQKAEELTNKVVENLIQQIDQLTSIANDFAQFANITTINPVNIDLNELLHQIQQLYKGYTNVDFVFSYSHNKAVIFADKLQINRLFTNLIKNAIEATQYLDNRTAKILIQQVVLSRSVIISICDNGIGIEETNKENIFKPNFTTKSSGTGLGLAMCKGIVENANGKIWFETSTNGTTFFIELPIVN